MKNLNFKRYSLNETFDVNNAQRDTIHIVPVSLNPLIVKMYDIDGNGNIAEISNDNDHKLIGIAELNTVPEGFGRVKYQALKSGTYLNFRDISGDPIQVTVDETEQFNVFINVSNGMNAIKQFSEKEKLYYNTLVESEAVSYSDFFRKIDEHTKTTLNYIKTLVWEDGTAMSDAKVDGKIFIKANGEYYVISTFKQNKYIDLAIIRDPKTSLTQNDFLFKNTVYIISNDFNLNGATINLPANCALKFENGIIRNGNLVGNKTAIIADCKKIFNLDLAISGTFKSEIVWADWYGSIAGDYSSGDLVNSLDRLYNVFETVNLNKGAYYTNIGGCAVKRLVGVSQADTIIDFRVNAASFCFSIGVVYGEWETRTYANEISDLTLNLDSFAGRKKGYTGIIVGATRKSLIKNVRVMANAELMKMTQTDLLDLYTDVSTKVNTIPNKGLTFLGDTELAMFENLFITADLPISFFHGCDFINFKNCIAVTNLHGFTNVYFNNKTYSNFTFDNLSMNRGLYGIYFDSSYDALLTNIVFRESRVEQLNPIKKIPENIFMGCAVYLGWRNWVENLNFTDFMVPSISNGFDIKEIGTGYIQLNNINCIDVSDEKKEFAVRVNFIENSPAKVVLNNVKFPLKKNEFNNVKQAVLSNGDFVSNELTTNKSLAAKNVINGSIVAKSDYNFNLDKKLRKRNEFMNIVVLNNNANFISVPNCNFSENTEGLEAKKITVEIFYNSIYSKAVLIYFKNLTMQLIGRLRCAWRFQFRLRA